MKVLSLIIHTVSRSPQLFGQYFHELYGDEWSWFGHFFDPNKWRLTFVISSCVQTIYMCSNIIVFLCNQVSENCDSTLIVVDLDFSPLLFLGCMFIFVSPFVFFDYSHVCIFAPCILDFICWTVTKTYIDLFRIPVWTNVKNLVYEMS